MHCLLLVVIIIQHKALNTKAEVNNEEEETIGKILKKLEINSKNYIKPRTHFDILMEIPQPMYFENDEDIRISKGLRKERDYEDGRSNTSIFKELMEAAKYGLNSMHNLYDTIEPNLIEKGN